jgi:putative solute:sodium symporter small subunit
MAEAVPPEERAPNEPRSTVPGEQSRGYWRANVRLQILLLAIWALFGYVLAILLAEVLNETTLADLPLGFWFAQQSAIYVFVILIFVYAFLMDRVDHEYGVQEEEIGWARKRLERRMQRRLTGEAPTDRPEREEEEQREVRRDE